MEWEVSLPNQENDTRWSDVCMMSPTTALIFGEGAGDSLLLPITFSSPSAASLSRAHSISEWREVNKGACRLVGI